MEIATNPSDVKSNVRHLDEKQGRRRIRKKPVWLDELLSQKFFTPCDLHSSSKKNERNIYCVDCSVPICQHCSRHSLHSMLQIRRYVYHDVVRLQDIMKLVDCAHVQPYIINSAKVVFLNRRQSAAKSSSVNVCRWCHRALQDVYKYCSVACKVDAVLQKGMDEEVDSMIRKTSSSAMAEAPMVYDNVNDGGHVKEDSFTLSSCRNAKSAVICDPSNTIISRRPSAAATPSPSESQQTTITAKSAVISADFNLSIAKLDGDSFEEEEQLSSPNSVLIDSSNGCGLQPRADDHHFRRRIPNYNSSDHDLISTTSSTSISSNGDYQQQKSDPIGTKMPVNKSDLIDHMPINGSGILSDVNARMAKSIHNCKKITPKKIYSQRNCTDSSCNAVDHSVIQVQSVICSRRKSTPRRSPIF